MLFILNDQIKCLAFLLILFVKMYKELKSKLCDYFGIVLFKPLVHRGE